MDRVGCQNCSQWVTDELRPENTWPRHGQPRLFVTSQWTESQAWYIAYRCLVAAAMLAWVLYDYYMETLVFYSPRYGLWFVFATDWAFLVLVLSSVFHAVLIVCFHIMRQSEPAESGEEKTCCCGANSESEMPVKYGLFWILYTIASCNAAVISFSYWTFLLALSKETVFLTTGSRVKHTVNSVIVLINLLLDGIPIRLLHVLYPILSEVLYVLFTVIYYLLGGRGPGWSEAIYPVLGWQSPGEAFVTIGLEMLLTILMHSVIYAVYRLRLLLQALFGAAGCSAGYCKVSAEEQANERRELIESDVPANGNQDYASMDTELR